MRSMLLSIMFCLISSVSWGDSVSWADLVENPGDGLIYKKFLTMPFTGVVMATADDPVQRSYKDGFKHGEWVEFHAKGLVKTKSEYEHGELQNGEQSGLSEAFKEDGSLRFPFRYENGNIIFD